MAGPAGMVLLGDRGAEESHDAVTGELVDRAPEPAHPLGQDPDQTTHDPCPVLGVKILLKVHRPLYVDEKNRELLSLSLGLDGRGLWREATSHRNHSRG